MEKYETFKCGHVRETDHKNPNQYHAVAYADVIGISGTGESGPVICRVWLLGKKEQDDPAYLIDWHDEEYEINKSIRKAIGEAKDNLVKLKDQIKESIFEKAYEMYKLKWMIDHGRTLADLMAYIQKEMDRNTVTVDDAFCNFESYGGFDGSCWSDREQFRYGAWTDEDYVKKLLTCEEYNLWLKL